MPVYLVEAGLIALTLGILVLDIFLKDNAKRGTTLANIAMTGVIVLLLTLATQWGNFGRLFGGTFIQDGVSYFFKFFFLLAAFFVLFMAREYQKSLHRGHSEFILLILFALIGMMFVASANDFLVFFVSLEILSVSFYIMTAYLRTKSASIEAGVKYLVLGALSTAIFLYGLSYIYGTTGSTSYPVIQERLAIMPSVPPAFLFGMAMVVASLCFKIAAVPFHLWAPDIYEGSPTPVTAYLSIGSKAAGFAALIRLMLGVFWPVSDKLTAVLAILAAVTIIYGNLGAIPQTNLKRLLGYSSIGHTGYLLIGMAAFPNWGREAVLYYLLSYLFSTAGVFLVIVAMSQHTKSDHISEYAGLSKRSPLLAAGMLMGLLSLAGVPPLAGFFGKFYLLWAGIRSGLFWLALIGVLNVITSLYYYLKVVKTMYVDKQAADAGPLKLTGGQKAMQYLSILGILALGVFQGPFVQFTTAAFQHVLK